MATILFILLQMFYIQNDTFTIHLQARDSVEAWNNIDTIQIVNMPTYRLRLANTPRVGGMILYTRTIAVLETVSDVFGLLCLFIFAVTLYGLKWNKNFKPKLK